MRDTGDSVWMKRLFSRLPLMAVAGTMTVFAGAGFADADRPADPVSISKAAAPQTKKKAMWGPVRLMACRSFPVYRDLGVGIYQMAVAWSDIAPTQPADPTDPA